VVKIYVVLNIITLPAALNSLLTQGPSKNVKDIYTGGPLVMIPNNIIDKQNFQ